MELVETAKQPEVAGQQENLSENLSFPKICNADEKTRQIITLQ